MNDHKRVPRGKVAGWSAGATRRNTRFLYSVVDDGLTGVGVALTLTLRDCPPTAREWHAIRRAWVERMRRRGLLRLHWITEWQRRGVPHLHAAAYFAEGEGRGYADMFAAWCIDAWAGIDTASRREGVAVRFGAEPWSQHAVPISDAIGWRQYVSKHASRGVNNYQRASAGIPEGWQGQTGRVWGTTGEWPTRDAVRIELAGREGDGGFFVFRRLVRGWRRADARAERVAAKRPGRIRSARAMLKCSDRGLSEVRGLSEWAEQDLQDGFLEAVAGMGYAVTG